MAEVIIRKQPAPTFPPSHFWQTWAMCPHCGPFPYGLGIVKPEHDGNAATTPKHNT